MIYEPVETALSRYLEIFKQRVLECEEINVQDSLERILYNDLLATSDLPAFNKALTDGYAVNAYDVATADQENPITLKIVGESNAGNVDKLTILKKEAVKVSAGSALPEGADAIVLPEDTLSENGYVKVFKSVTNGKNTARKGDDILAGQVFIKKQRKIRPQDIGGIIGLGYKKIQVYRKPVVSIIPTGSELVSINDTVQAGQLIESNSHVVESLVKQLGGINKTYSIVKDNLDDIREAIICALKDSDIIIISGGSSLGDRDYTLRAIKSIENSNIISHGIAMRPGKQTLLATIDNKPVIGLPGNPASALIAFTVFVKPILNKLVGNKKSFWQQKKENVKINAVLAKDVESPENFEDYIIVRLVPHEDGKITVYPYPGKSSFLFTLAKAHGLIKLAPECTKLYEGDSVEVLLF